MKKHYLLLLTMLLVLVTLAGCSSNEQLNGSSEKDVELTISAAASLQEALNEIKGNFEKEYSNVKIHFNFGASGALAQQISQGAPVDLFFSAAEDKFDKLVKAGLIEESKGTDLIGNELVLIVPNDSKKEIHTFEELTKVDKISIGTPEAVPAGQYAKETLEESNVWNDIEERVVYAKDVRQVLTYVETNNVDAGIVYKTDALISEKVKIIATADGKTHTPILYPIGVVKSTKNPNEAQLFYDYLRNETAIKTFEKFGFKNAN